MMQTCGFIFQPGGHRKALSAAREEAPGGRNQNQEPVPSCLPALGGAPSSCESGVLRSLELTYRGMRELYQGAWKS